MTGPTQLTIYPMTASDIDSVLEIEAESFPTPWTRAHFIAEVQSVHSFPMVARHCTEGIVGYVCPMVVVDEGHILNIAVRGIGRGKGIGRLLLETALDECSSRGSVVVSLEVRPSNLAAIALYRGIGFVVVGRRKRYYENGEDAMIMEYDFGKDSDDAV
jgi:ribosomal-protein-alanine N-acetyltransferase